MSETLTFNIGEAKTQLSKLVALAESGREVIVSRDGRPAVRLEPISPKVPVFGFWPMDIPDSAFFDPISAEELSLWENGPVFPEGV